MKLLTCFVLVSAVMCVHGYKNTNNLNNGGWKSQLVSLPGGTYQKHAYPGTVNTRYGSNDGHYEQQESNSQGNYAHGCDASNHHKSVTPDYPESYEPTNKNEYGSSESYGNGESEYYEQQQEVPKHNSWDKEFAKDVLTKHNFYRVQHATPTVSLDEKMSRIAQDWATQLATGARDGHSPEAVEGEYGESIQIVAVRPTGNQVVTKWYQEKANYDFRQPILVKSPAFRANRHFTAMIWYGTRKIGVGKARSNDGRTYVVVNYWPAGNILDVLEDNVLPPRSNH